MAGGQPLGYTSGNRGNPGQTGAYGGGPGQPRKIEVVVRRIRHTFEPDEYIFTKEDGTDIPPSTKHDWKLSQRGRNEAAWVYLPDNDTVYWTKRLH
jgi:hypothetical protein